MRFLSPAEIGPARIERFNQCDFLASAPALELLLARDRIRDFVVCLEVNQPLEVISLRKTRIGAFLMLAHSVVEIVAHAYVEDVRPIRHDVNVVLAHRKKIASRRSFDSSSFRSG